MITASIYGAFNVPGKTSTASTHTLQWTPDGQLLVITETMVYILTPETGLKLDGDMEPSKSRLIQWAVAAIALPPISTVWAEVSPEMAAIAIGTVDYNWSAVTSSPTGYSPVGSCLLVTLTSNLEILLWAPKNNPYRGEWEQIQNVTEDLMKTFQTTAISDVQLATLSQSHAIAWSHQPISNRSKDASLLAIGNAAGVLLLTRIDNDGQLKQVTSLQISDNWVTELRWTQWNEDPSFVTATLACLSGNQEIHLVKVVQRWSEDGSSLVTASRLDAKPYEKDRRYISAIQWIEVGEDSPLLVHCKPGDVILWREDNPSSWNGIHKLSLETQPTSTASSSFVPASGITYLHQHDALVVSLVDGSYHAIYQIHENPTIQNTQNSSCTSLSMSQHARAVFLIAEDHEVDKPKDGSEPPKLYRNHYPKTTGVQLMDSAGVFVWIHERILTESFAYVADFKVHSMIMMAPLVTPEEYDKCALKEITLAFERGNHPLLQAPVAALRGAYTHLRRRAFVERNREALLQILSGNNGLEAPDFSEPMEEDFSSDWIVRLTEELVDALFGYRSLSLLRLMHNVAMECSITMPDEEKFSLAVARLRIRIQEACLIILLSLLNILPTSSLQVCKALFLQNMLHRLKERNLESAGFDKLAAALVALSPNAVEFCPACQEPIEFEDTELAKCGNGHYWSRCSVTSYILSTPEVQTCICCGLKSLIPPKTVPSEELPEDWLTSVILNACQVCIICGNRRVKVV